MKQSVAIFAVFLIGNVVSHYPNANYDSIVFTKLNPVLISNQDHSLPQDATTVLLPSFREPLVRKFLTSYEPPQAHVPFTTYELPMQKTIDNVFEPGQDYGIPSAKSASFNAQSEKKDEQSANFLNSNTVSSKFQVPSTETPTKFLGQEPSSTQNAVFKTLNSEYGVPSKKSSDFNVLRQEYGLPEKTIPFSKYEVPSLKTHNFADDNVQLIPSTSYGIPAERVPVPIDEYKVPTVTLPLEQLSSEYGLPDVRVPASIYGLPH